VPPPACASGSIASSARLLSLLLIAPALALAAWLRWRLRRRCGASLRPESDAARPAEQSAAAQSGVDASLVTWVRRGAISSVATAVLAIMLWWAPPAEIFWQSE